MRTTVVGLGKSGEAAARLLIGMGESVLIVDDQKKEIPSSLLALSGEALSRLHYRLGEWTPNDLFSSDRVVLSPGVFPSRLPLKSLAERGVPVVSEVELAASYLSAPIIAVTGTNGKSSTTTWVGEILKQAGHSVFVGGNLGVPLSEAVGDSWEFVVAEVSSFQLETIVNFHPRFAALLNITPDHMDRYPTFEAYQQAKWRIFKNQSGQDAAVIPLPSDDPMSSPPSLAARPIHFSWRSRPERGVFVEGEKMVHNIHGCVEEVVPIREIPLLGRHNLENLMAATALCSLCGLPADLIGRAIRGLTGLPHRMELVREVRGVRYINDSKGTNVGAVLKSLEGMNDPVVLIAGGRGKGSDFSLMKERVCKKVKRLILMGETRGAMSDCFSDHPDQISVETMEEAVSVAAASARAGDVVLLSPAAASFDMFKDFQDRGERFREAVARLSQ